MFQHTASGAAHDSQERKPAPTCLRGTYDSLLTNLFDWVENPGHHRIFWLHGRAGSGKSALAQTVAEHCEQKEKLAASFFFYRTKEDRSNAQRVFPTITYQLTKSIPSTKPAIMKILRTDPSVLHQSPREQLQKLIIHPLVTLAEPLSAPMIVIIDALDECEDDKVLAELISLVAEVLDDGIRIPLQFFFTGRPEKHLRDIFEDAKVKSKTRSLSLDHLDNQENVRVYLKGGFDDMLGRNWSQSTTLCNRYNTLVELVDGSFIYASTALRLISENLGHNLSSDPLAIILTLPRGIDSLYKMILSMHPYNDGERVIIGTILLLRSHLSLEDIATLLGLTEFQIQDALRHFHSIFHVPDRVFHPVRIYHISLYDFLVNKPCSGDFINPKQHHANIARSCLKLMTRDLKRDMNAVEDIGDEDEDSENDSGEIHAAATGLQVDALLYACCYWTYHLSESLAEDTTQLLDNVEEFALTKALCWIEALSINGMLESAEQSLVDAMKWLAVRFPYSQFQLPE